MQIFRYKQDKRFYYRVIVLVVLIAIFISVATESIWKIRVAAERTHVAWMVGAIESSIGMEVAKRAVKGGLAQIALLDRTNPLLLLDNQERLMMGVFHYLGELEVPDPAKISPGNWYFDIHSRELIYRVAMVDAFTTNLDGAARIRFSLMGRYAGRGRQRLLSGLSLVALDEYHWSTESEGDASESRVKRVENSAADSIE